MFLIVGVLPISLLMLVALHVTVKDQAMRMIAVIVGTVACVMSGWMHFVFIGIILICVEIIINKVFRKL